jgi:di/tripeptidase
MNNACEIENLLELFKIYSPSKKEHPTVHYIIKKLEEMKVSYKVDFLGNVYNIFNKDKPVIMAHMDSVPYMKEKSIFKKRNIIIEENIIKSNGFNIGADDKCGIWICLELLKKYPDINFMFTTEEEIGSNGAKFIEQGNSKYLENINFGLSFDRKGNRDIIFSTTKGNLYSTDDMFCHNILMASCENGLGFRETKGSFCDCDIFSGYFNCVNISSGYYNPHTKKEYCNIDDMKKTLSFGEEILKRLYDKKYNVDLIKFHEKLVEKIQKGE